MQKINKYKINLQEEQKIKETTDIWIVPFIALMTGMRKGEILALQWKDIDFENDTISVTKSVWYESDTPIVGTPKTKESIRLVPLANELKEKLLALSDKKPNNFIISDDGENPLTNKRYQALSKNYSEQTGVFCTVHELRHRVISSDNKISSL